MKPDIKIRCNPEEKKLFELMRDLLRAGESAQLTYGRVTVIIQAEQVSNAA